MAYVPKPSKHGAGCSLRNTGNDGSAMIEEYESGIIEVTINGDDATLANVGIIVNGIDSQTLIGKG